MKLLTIARDLHRRRGRERTGLFLAEGVRTVEELLSSSIGIRGVLVAPALAVTERGAELGQRLMAAALSGGMELVQVTDSELASAADTDSPQGVVAIAAQPERSFDAVVDLIVAGGRMRIVTLDGVQDPGNVGTILRTAEAFGVSATVALGGTADLWNPKVIRSAMGALFRQHALAASTDDFLAFCRANEVAIWTTGADGEPLALGAGAPERLAIVVGNEGNGVSAALRAAANRTVAIPITGVESLNVAVATGILLYTLSRK
ncbi:MAG: TrmH family RNA methyltransferase [Gemmatimonadaceae bacterium]